MLFKIQNGLCELIFVKFPLSSILLTYWKLPSRVDVRVRIVNCFVLLASPLIIHDTYFSEKIQGRNKQKNLYSDMCLLPYILMSNPG